MRHCLNNMISELSHIPFFNTGLQHFVESMLYEIIKTSCVLLKVKTGPFFEHSNTLWGISNVPTWSKVNSGLLKMYKAEVSNALFPSENLLLKNFVILIFTGVVKVSGDATFCFWFNIVH